MRISYVANDAIVLNLESLLVRLVFSLRVRVFTLQIQGKVVENKKEIAYLANIALDHYNILQNTLDEICDLAGKTYVSDLAQVARSNILMAKMKLDVLKDITE